MAEVRRATAADVEALVAMGRALHAESPRYREMRFDAEKVRRLARDMLGTLLGGNTCVLVAETGGEIVGMCALVLSERWFGPDLFVTDLTVYVKPEPRGSSAFVRMVRAMEAWARAQHALELDIGVSTDIGTDRTVCAYLRLGYKLSPTRIVTKTLHHGD